MISLDDSAFGVSNTTPVYGYALLGGDVTALGSGQIDPDWTSSNYPLSQEGGAANGSIGLDPLALNFGIVDSASVPWEFSPSLGLLISGGALLGINLCKKRYKNRKSLDI